MIMVTKMNRRVIKLRLRIRKRRVKHKKRKRRVIKLRLRIRIFKVTSKSKTNNMKIHHRSQTHQVLRKTINSN